MSKHVDRGSHLIHQKFISGRQAFVIFTVFDEIHVQHTKKWIFHYTGADRSCHVVKLENYLIQNT